MRREIGARLDVVLTNPSSPNRRTTRRAVRSSHLAMLEALAGREHVGLAYEAALEGGYLRHEFGDVHLIRRDER